MWQILMDDDRDDSVAAGAEEARRATVLRPLVQEYLKGTGGVDRTWGSCGAFSVCDGQPTIENCGPCDGYSVSPFGRPPHPSALSHAGIGNVID